MDFLDNAVAGAVPVISGMKVMSPAEKQLRPILFDEGIQVLSNFELNQVASLTYNDITCDGIFELIERICRKPLDHTPLTLQKSLITTKHVLIFGSEKTVNHAYGILDYIKALLEFNTVLMTQKQGGAMSFFQTLQGGGVDKGGPIREVAAEVVKLLSNINELRRIRTSSASKDSLVPVGDDGVAFVTDDVRLHILKRKIEDEKRVRIRSNLKKSEGGFGAGYTSQNGKSVVGASHGIEEMIKMANIQTKKFSDDDSRPPGHRTPEEIILEELKAEYDAAKAVAASHRNSSATGLLGPFNPTELAAPDVDLLDFGTSCGGNLTVNNHIGITGDLLGGNMYTNSGASSAVSNDPFSLTNQYTSTSYNCAPANNLLDLMAAPVLSTSAVDPFAAMNDVSNKSNNNINDSMNNLNMNLNNNNNNPTMMMQIPVPTSGDITAMNSMSLGMTNISPAAGATSSLSMPSPIDGPMMTPTNEDRFAALDALATPQSSIVTALDAKNAENRLYNQDTNYLSSYNNNMMSSTDSIPSRMSGSASVCSTGGSDGYSFSTPMGMLPPVPAVQENMIAPGSGQVAKSYGKDVDTNEDNPWMMGGSAGDGQGLIPVGPPPRSAPPPPPPC